MNASSIRFRLTAWYAGIFGAALIVLAAFGFAHLRGYLERALLETQLRRARQIASTLAAAPSPAIAAQIETLYAPEASGRFIRITRPDGSVLYRSGAPADAAFNPAAVPPGPSGIAAFAHRQPMPSGPGLLIAAAPAAGGDRVEVGISAQPVDDLFHHLLVLLGFGLPAAAVAAALGGYLLVGRALRPVERIARRAESITQHNLSERLPVALTGDELERLALALNRMIARLDDAFRNSRQFVADASHELRTPLTILRGELESLAQDQALSASVRESLGSLLEEVERLSRIVEQLLAISRLDAGEARSEGVAFDLAELVAATAGQMALLAEDRRIALACDTPSAVPVLGDRSRLKQVVVNLLDNAIKYTPEGGSVRLAVSAAGGQALLEVSDTGVGIPPEALPHVFDRFFRADPSRSRQTDGAGLGLAIVKSICQAHGGAVEVESSLGQGSRFRVRLPQTASS